MLEQTKNVKLGNRNNIFIRIIGKRKLKGLYNFGKKKNKANYRSRFQPN